jgi:hypothetical protein
MMKGRSPPRQVGERVNARYYTNCKGERYGNFYAGKIAAVNSNGTFVVHYDDGGKDDKVAESDLMRDSIGLHIIAIDTIATPEVPKVTVVFVEGFAEGSPAEAAKNEGNICIGDVLTTVNDIGLTESNWRSMVRPGWQAGAEVSYIMEGTEVAFRLKLIRDEALLSIFRRRLRQCVKEEADQRQDASAGIELASVMAPTVSAAAGSMTAGTVPPDAAPGPMVSVPVQAQVVRCEQQAQVGQAHVAQAQVVEVKQQRYYYS